MIFSWFRRLDKFSAKLSAIFFFIKACSVARKLCTFWKDVQSIFFQSHHIRSQSSFRSIKAFQQVRLDWHFNLVGTFAQKKMSFRSNSNWRLKKRPLMGCWQLKFKAFQRSWTLLSIKGPLVRIALIHLRRLSLGLWRNELYFALLSIFPHESHILLAVNLNGQLVCGMFSYV